MHGVTVRQEPVIAAASKYVPASILSGITVQSNPSRLLAGCTEMFRVPIPVIVAPMLSSAKARSATYSEKS